MMLQSLTDRLKMLENRSVRLTQEWQKNGVVVGHHKQVNTVQSSTSLQVAKRLTQVAVLGTITYKHLKHKGGKQKQNDTMHRNTVRNNLIIILLVLLVSSRL